MLASRNRRLRRKRSRINFLKTLAEQNYPAFSHEWQKVVEGWSHEAQRRARVLIDADGIPTTLAFEVIKEVQDILVNCGTEAYQREWPATRSILTQVCCVAISEATGHALLPKTFAQLVPRGM